MKRVKVFSGWVAALLFVSSCSIFAQTVTTGDITGTVKDSSGAAVAGATVTLKSLDTGQTRTATTNDTGSYRFTLLAGGNYSVTASSPGLVSDTARSAVEVGQV